MDRNCSIEVLVRGREPEAQYQGRIYDQTVVVKPLAEGVSIQQLQIFDSDSPLQVSDSTIGTQCAIPLRIRPKECVRVQDVESEIQTVENPDSRWSYALIGTVEAVDTEDGLLQLAVAQGCIVVELTDVVRDLHEQENGLVGATVRISSSRTDLIDISGLE